jgi:RNA polymerase sigma factor (sigma-70 family)
LSTYAVWWIRQAMQRAVASSAYPVRLNSHCLRNVALHHGSPARPPRSIDAAPAPGPAPESLRLARAAMRPALSLDAIRDDRGRRIDIIGDAAADPSGAMDTGETLARLMSLLGPRERQVVSLRFGLGGREQLTLGDVGRLLGVSRERIRQIQEAAMNKLRQSPPPRPGSIPSLQERR